MHEKTDALDKICNKVAYFIAAAIKFVCTHKLYLAPWSELTYIYASSNGHLEILKYARENGCPRDENLEM